MKIAQFSRNNTSYKNQEIILNKKRNNTKWTEHPSQVKRKKKKSGRKDLIRINIENHGQPPP